MSLPSNMSAEEYFEACVTFFEEYQFLFTSPNTELLIHGTLDKINVQNLHNNIMDENYDITEDNDIFLKRFFMKASRIMVTYNNFEGSCEESVDAPLSVKKRHEITYLTKEIIDVCGQTECDTIVDFGSGLGYLDQLIHQKSNYKVLGIESNATHHVAAKKRQRKYHTDSTENVKFKKHTICEDSHRVIQEFLDDKFPDRGKICITGLHACADLTVTALNIFLKMADAQSMVLMPCCYHLMTVEDGRFKNFPLSECLKRIVEGRNGYGYLGIPFLRLGAHPPDLHGSLDGMIFNLLARAVLQLYAYNHGYKLRRRKRKPIKAKNCDFELYIQDIEDGFALTTKNSEKVNTKFDLDQLQTLWREVWKDSILKKAAIFVKLQNYLQIIIENFVLCDRLTYLRENGIGNCRCKKIFNERVSPRCLALLVCK